MLEISSISDFEARVRLIVKVKIMRLLAFLIGFVVFVIAFFCTTTLFVPDPYETSYQRAIAYQYDYIRSLGSGKIVAIGPSSLSFGFDGDLMEDISGRPCVILGNHAGMTDRYFYEMSKSYLQEGDIVIAEYTGIPDGNVGVQLLFSGIGNRLDMMRFLPITIKNMKTIIKEYPEFFRKTLDYSINGGLIAKGSYSMESYDERGNMSVYRGDCTIPFPFDDEVAKTYNYYSYSTNFAQEPVHYFNGYTAWCNERGISVYVIRVPCLDEALKSTEDEIKASDAVLAELLDAPLITDSTEYVYTRDYIYNAILHCNTQGAKLRTMQIWEDMREHIG